MGMQKTIQMDREIIIRKVISGNVQTEIDFDHYRLRPLITDFQQCLRHQKVKKE